MNMTTEIAFTLGSESGGHVFVSYVLEIQSRLLLPDNFKSGKISFRVIIIERPESISPKVSVTFQVPKIFRVLSY